VAPATSLLLALLQGGGSGGAPATSLLLALLQGGAPANKPQTNRVRIPINNIYTNLFKRLRLVSCGAKSTYL